MLLRRWHCAATRHAALRGASTAASGVLTEGITRADFRRFCIEQQTSLVEGVPTSAFVAYLQRVHGTDSVEAQLRDMPCFVFDGPRVKLDNPNEESPLAFEDDLRRFASQLPEEGLDGDAAKVQLMKAVPLFSPKLVGCVTLREVFGRFSHLFTVSRGGDAWTVKPAPSHRSKAPTTIPPESGSTACASRDEALERHLVEALQLHCARHGLSHTEWVDVEPLIRTVPNELHDRSTDWVRVVAGLKQLEAKATLVARPKRRPRGAHVLVDGDGLTCHHVDSITARLGLNMNSSTTAIHRQPSTPALTTQDVIVPLDLPTYHAVEVAAEALRRAHHVVLKDVVFVCNDAKAALYQRHVALAVPFPDAEVWVASPSTEVCVASWRLPPLTWRPPGDDPDASGGSANADPAGSTDKNGVPS